MTLSTRAMLHAHSWGVHPVAAKKHWQSQWHPNCFNISATRQSHSGHKHSGKWSPIKALLNKSAVAPGAHPENQVEVISILLGKHEGRRNSTCERTAHEFLEVVSEWVARVYVWVYL